MYVYGNMSMNDWGDSCVAAKLRVSKCKWRRMDAESVMWLRERRGDEESVLDGRS